MKNKFLSLFLAVIMVVTAFCSVLPVIAQESTDETASESKVGAPTTPAELTGADKDAVAAGYVCRIGEELSQFKYYETFQKAISDAENGETITLIANVERTDKDSINKNITIDGNGYTYTAKNVTGFSTDMNSDGIELTVKNLTVKVVDGSQSFIAIASTKSNTVKCENCTFITEQAMKYDPTATATSGYFLFNKNGGILEMSACDIQIKNSETTGGIFAQSTTAAIVDIQLTDVKADVATDSPKLNGFLFARLYPTTANVVMNGSTVVYTGAACITSASNEERTANITLNGTSQLKSNSMIVDGGVNHKHHFNLYINDEASFEAPALCNSETEKYLKVFVTSTAELKDYAAPQMQTGASVRVSGNYYGENGIRFSTVIADGAKGARLGVMIAKWNDISEKEFTLASLNGVAHLNQTVDLPDPEAGTKIDGLSQNNGPYTYNVALVNLNSYTEKFAARAYAKYTVNDSCEVTVYSTFNSGDNVRSIQFVANAALNDLKDELTGDYRFEEALSGKYSCYTPEQYTRLSHYVENDAKTYANLWTYKTEGGITVREVTIDSGKGGDAVEIVQLSDLHLNLYNDQDIAEANPALMSTIENRKWLKDGGSIPNIQKCLDYAKNADQIVLTGDILDYLSYGALEWIKNNVFDAFAGKLMAVLGNHDATRKMEGTVDDPTILESRLDILQSYWPNDIHYSSKVLGEKVMIIQMDNASRDSTAGEYFWDEQIEPFKADLATARENGYVVLIFYHIPIATQNPGYNTVTASMQGNGAVGNWKFFSTGANSASDHPATREIYNLIVNNADIIKGTFCGHRHSDFYTEIKAKTADGMDAVIPQYCLMGVPYDTGNALKIIVK